MSSWDTRYMDLAHYWATTCSKDPSTKVGAVVVGVNPRDIALGYNGFPRGVEDTTARLNDRAVKYKLTAHAERNALDNSAFDIEGATLYVTMHVCSECAKSVVSRRLARVVCPPAFDREPWRADAEWARLILKEGGVDLVVYM